MVREQKMQRRAFLPPECSLRTHLPRPSLHHPWQLDLKELLGSEFSWGLSSPGYCSSGNAMLVMSFLPFKSFSDSLIRPQIRVIRCSRPSVLIRVPPAGPETWTKMQ